MQAEDWDQAHMHCFGTLMDGRARPIIKLNDRGKTREGLHRIACIQAKSPDAVASTGHAYRLPEPIEQA
jgi:hypothetical protein